MHSPLASPSATRAALAAHGLQTRKSLGQHFLVDDNIVGRILELARLSGDEPVLEIGPGIGTLTVALAQHAGYVTCVERDTRLEAPLAEVRRSHSNVNVIFADALDVTEADLTSPLGPPVALVANLPYAVAATVVLRAFEEMASIRYAVVMVQAEVADRMAAQPGTKDYGAYTVKLGLRAGIQGRFNVGRACFMPPPNVDSSVVRLERASGQIDERAVQAGARMAEAAFSQRRKTIRNAVRAHLAVESGLLESVLVDAGIDGSARAETLPVESYVKLGVTAREYGLLP